MFHFAIDLGLKIGYGRCREGNISVVRMHSRRAYVETIWYIIYIAQIEEGAHY